MEGEQDRSPESEEEQKYQALQAAFGEEHRIMREMDNVFASTTDRVELERWASLMDAAVKKTSEAIEDWLDFVRKAGEREREDE